VACRQIQQFFMGYILDGMGEVLADSGRFNQRRVDKDYLTRPVTRAVAMDSAERESH